MKKILIVEDDQIVANIYRNKFSVEGYQVEIASDGQAGLETLHSFKPDAVILDLMLPKITGVELMKKVRAEPEFKNLPIIVFSNTYLTNMVQDAWKAGATKCLSKANCSPKQLLEVVHTTLAGNGAAPGAAAPKAGPATAPPQGAAPAPASGPAPGDADWDAKFQAELKQSFVESLPAALTALRASLQAVIKNEDEPTRVKQLQEMYRKVHGLTSNAGITGIGRIAQMCDALEALLKELHEKPRHINASTLRTVASAIDFLSNLLERKAFTEDKAAPPPKILVVDDEAISRRAVTYALEKAKLKSVNVENPQNAYTLVTENRFDMIFLDVDMPGMNGFELCAKLRNLPAHKKTPVIFVTGLNDLESRANSMVSGGNDFIVKPFLFIELAVKALVYILRARINPGA
jgi:DNA-binding response OmpR family regulator